MNESSEPHSTCDNPGRTFLRWPGAVFRLIFVLAASLLMPAAGAEAATSLPISVPFAFIKHELLVQLYIGTAGPYTFMFDSDTTPSVIDLRLARQLRLSTVGTAGSGSGIGGHAPAAVSVKMSDVRLGAVHVAQLDALAVDLSGLSNRFGRPVNGVLGTNFLADRVVQIDYACRSISFLPDAILAPYSARFNGVDGVPGSGDNISQDVWIGSKRVVATFDTGDSGSSFVPAKGITDLDLRAAARAGRVTTTAGFAGAAPATEGALANVRIGQTVIGSMKTEYIPSARAADVPYDVNIGNQTLARFVVIFDYQRGLLTLRPATGCPAERHS